MPPVETSVEAAGFGRVRTAFSTKRCYASGMQLATWDRSHAKLDLCDGERSLLGSLVNSKARGEFAGIFRAHAGRHLHDGQTVMEMAGHAMAWPRITQFWNFAAAPLLDIEAARMEAATAWR